MEERRLVQSNIPMRDYLWGYTKPQAHGTYKPHNPVTTSGSCRHTQDNQLARIKDIYSSSAAPAVAPASTLTTLVFCSLPSSPNTIQWVATYLSDSLK